MRQVAARAGARAFDDRAARERKQKIFLGVGVGLLALLLAWQAPKTLRQLRGGQAASPAPAVQSAVADPGSTATPAPALRSASLAPVLRFPVRDPFVVQVGSGAAGAVAIKPALAGPPVRMSHFVRKDPFVAQVVLGTPKPVSPPPVTGRIAVGKGGFIVVLASVPTSRGDGEAKRQAARAKHAGLQGVGFVESDKYATLRSGYFAVYSGTYRTVGAVLKALEAARAAGYSTAYTRSLGA